MLRPYVITMRIERLTHALAELCEAQFSNIGWSKPTGYFGLCLAEQTAGALVMFVAHDGTDYAGHVKLVWEPSYPHFRNAGMPEIQDLNVLPPLRKQGIATSLIGRCEALAGTVSAEIGIGVGLHSGYNNAQRLYTKLGYILDGKGVYYGAEPVIMGESYRFDDDLVIHFTKQLA